MPQNITKPDTCEPRLAGFDTSACQTLVVAKMPPVPKPNIILEIMNCENWKEFPINITPTSSIAVAAKIVHLRPHMSPKKVQAKDPNTPPRTNKAITVPVQVLPIRPCAS